MATRYDYYWARDHVADDLHYGIVEATPEAIAKDFAFGAGVPSDVAADWATRFLGDLQRHRDPAEVARRKRRAEAPDTRALHVLTDEAARLACRDSRWTGTWNRAKADAIALLREGGPIPSAQDLANRVVRDALARRRAG